MFSVTPDFYAILTVFFVMGLVYWDATRRGLPQQTRSRWTGCVGFVSSCGFVLSITVFDDILIWIYKNMSGHPPMMVFTPYDFVMMLFKIGVAISALAVLMYVIGSRFGPLKPQTRS
jgi:hypothetical protein